MIAQTIANYLGVFQSTLPIRGATAILTEETYTMAISIHTPHTGSDSKSYRIHIKFKNKIYDIRNKNKYSEQKQVTKLCNHLFLVFDQMKKIIFLRCESPSNS